MTTGSDYCFESVIWSDNCTNVYADIDELYDDWTIFEELRGWRFGRP